MMKRECGSCTLCCKLLPMKADKPPNFSETINMMEKHGMLRPREWMTWTQDFAKPAGERCPHQRHGKGCSIYERRPFGCRTWSCRWLTSDDTRDLARPDRSHYVIDLVPDYVTSKDSDTGKTLAVPVLQIWCDPNYPEAHRDPALRAYLQRRGEQEHMAALVRFPTRGLFICPPALAPDGQWHEVESMLDEAEHTAEQKAEVLGPMTVVMEPD